MMMLHAIINASSIAQKEDAMIIYLRFIKQYLR